MRPVNDVLASYGTTIFETMSQLARTHGAINLGQGFPDGNGPDDVREMAVRALSDRPNQYPPMMGTPELRGAVAAHNKRFYGIDLDGESEVMVTSGATEALTACLMALLNPGDEAIIIEPAYDSYIPIIRVVGAVPKLVKLAPPHWTLPRAELEAAFGPRTKLIVINSPMNPTGKVFSDDDLGFIAGLLQKHDAYAICDEVYEHIVFGGARHVPLLSLPGMRERVLRIGSAGKTFLLTGWKVGYVSADRSLIASIARAHQFLTFTTPPNLQRAAAYGLGKEDGYFAALGATLGAKCDRLRAGLETIGFAPARSSGTFFLNADVRGLGFNGDSFEFCRRMTIDAGVTAVPIAAFYQDAGTVGEAGTLIRFNFCKDEDVLDEALARLKRHFAGRAAHTVR
jgi:aspartate/methionine/tyrosine aminotransferase